MSLVFQAEGKGVINILKITKKNFFPATTEIKELTPMKKRNCIFKLLNIGQTMQNSFLLSLKIS